MKVQKPPTVAERQNYNLWKSFNFPFPKLFRFVPVYQHPMGISILIFVGYFFHPFYIHSFLFLSLAFIHTKITNNITGSIASLLSPSRFLLIYAHHVESTLVSWLGELKSLQQRSISYTRVCFTCLRKEGMRGSKWIRTLSGIVT